MKIITFFTLFSSLILISQQSFESVDQLISNKKFDFQINKNTFSNNHNDFSVDIAEFPDNQFGIAYINSNKNLEFMFIQNGEIIQQNQTSLTTSNNINSIQVLALDNSQLLIAYSTKTTYVDMETYYIMIVNGIDGQISTPAIQLVTNLNTSFLKMIKISDNSLAITYSIKEDRKGWKLKLQTFGLQTPQFNNDEISIGNPPISNDQQQWHEYNSVLTILPSNKLLVIFQGNGPQTPTVGKSDSIFRKTLTIQGDSIVLDPAENLVQIHGQENLKYQNPQIIPTQDPVGGYALIWSLQNAIYYALYDDQHQPKCDNGQTLMENEASYAYMTYKDNIAYLVYIKDNKLMGLEINIKNCDIEREGIVIQDSEIASNSYPALAITSLPQTSPVKVNILMVFSIGQSDPSPAPSDTYSLYMSEFFINQDGFCSPNFACQGCYGIYDCPICGGSSIDIRLLQSRQGDQCSCIDGYYQTGQEIDCKKCSRQCKKCDQNNECLECQNSDMMLPSCLHQKKGNFQYEENGVWHYKQCSFRCQNCLNQKDGKDKCTSCDGENRIDDSTCNCKVGYHDNNGELQDCVKCQNDCLECSSQHICHKCDPSQNKILNIFTGQCQCQLGYEFFDEYKTECKKCFKLSDGCVEKCPENTIENTQEYICEYQKLVQKEKSSPLLYIFAAIILLFQLIICCCIYHKLKKNYKIFVQDQIEHQQKIKLQRDFIHNSMEGGKSNIILDRNNSEVQFETNMNFNTESPFKQKLNNNNNESALKQSDTQDISYSDLHHSNIKLLGTNLDKSSHKNLHNFEPSLYEDMEQKRIEGIIEQEEEINSHLSKSQLNNVPLSDDSRQQQQSQSSSQNRSRRTRKNRSNLATQSLENQQNSVQNSEYQIMNVMNTSFSQEQQHTNLVDLSPEKFHIGGEQLQNQQEIEDNNEQVLADSQVLDNNTDNDVQVINDDKEQSIQQNKLDNQEQIINGTEQEQKEQQNDSQQVVEMDQYGNTIHQQENQEGIIYNQESQNQQENEDDNKEQVLLENSSQSSQQQDLENIEAKSPSNSEQYSITDQQIQLENSSQNLPDQNNDHYDNEQKQQHQQQLSSSQDDNSQLNESQLENQKEIDQSSQIAGKDQSQIDKENEQQQQYTDEEKSSNDQSQAGQELQNQSLNDDGDNTVNATEQQTNLDQQKDNNQQNNDQIQENDVEQQEQIDQNNTDQQENSCIENQEENQHYNNSKNSSFDSKQSQNQSQNSQQKEQITDQNNNNNDDQDQDQDQHENQQKQQILDDNLESKSNINNNSVNQDQSQEQNQLDDDEEEEEEGKKKDQENVLNE